MKQRKKTSAARGQQKQGDHQQLTLGGMAEGLWEEKMLSTGELYSGQPDQRPVKDPVVDKLVRE